MDIGRHHDGAVGLAPYALPQENDVTSIIDIDKDALLRYNCPVIKSIWLRLWVGVSGAFFAGACVGFTQALELLSALGATEYSALFWGVDLWCLCSANWRSTWDFVLGAQATRVSLVYGLLTLL